MLTKEIPRDWRDLQSKVWTILGECGFEAEIEKKVPTARGTVELDVYAQEDIKGRKYSIICECKYWGTSIPQNVVHGFRTVVSDLGCNVGYIITTSDYQKGAITTSTFTNIELLTWKQFLEKLFRSWYENYFVNKITDELELLTDYLEPLMPNWFAKMSGQHKEQYFVLQRKYGALGFIVAAYFTRYARILQGPEIPPLPIKDMFKDSAASERNISLELLTETGYRDFLEKVIVFGKSAIAEFHKLRSRYETIDWPL